MDDAVRAQIADQLALLPTDQLEGLGRRYDWLQTARPDQLPPEDYFVWLLMAGRGAGKTRSGAEDIWWSAYTRDERIAVLGPTLPDIRKTAFEGESGLLSRIPPSLVINYNRTSLELWTKTMSGGTSYFVGYSAEEPERLRGPQHHRAWCDELGAWNPKKAMDVWDNLLFGLRLGSSPRIVVTTTPRTTPLLRAIVKDSTTKISRASTFANKHLPESILKKFKEKYEGTRLGRQELEAELLEDVVGALWTDEMVQHEPIEYVWQDDDIVRIVVAVDPSGSSGDSIGIVVVGAKIDGTYVVLADKTINGSPAEWGRAAVKAYEDFGADRLVAEVNFGGAMVEAVIRNVDPDVSYQEVRASRGKIVRAEPVAALYEQGKVTHVRGLVELEKQMMLMTNEGYVGEGSPDRVDALVWALSTLSKKRSRKETSLAVEGERKAA